MLSVSPIHSGIDPFFLVMHDHVSIMVSLCSFSPAVGRTIFLICISLSPVVIRVIHWLHFLALCYFSSCGKLYYIYFFIQCLIISWCYLCHPFTSVWFHFPRVFLCLSLFFHSVYHYLQMLSTSSIHNSVLALCHFSACIVVFAASRFFFSFFFIQYLIISWCYPCHLFTTVF